jgi:hypothetical protein
MGIMGRHGDYACHHGKSDKSMGYPMENHDVFQQAMGYPHYMPWESWDAMAITLVTMGNPINPWGIPWKTI